MLRPDASAPVVVINQSFLVVTLLAPNLWCVHSLDAWRSSRFKSRISSLKTFQGATEPDLPLRTDLSGQRAELAKATCDPRAGPRQRPWECSREHPRESIFSLFSPSRPPHQTSHEGVHASAHESVHSSGWGLPVLFAHVLFLNGLNL